MNQPAFHHQKESKIKRANGKRIGARVVSYAILLFWIVITLIPLYWMLVMSFKDTSMSASFSPEWFPKNPSVATYIRFFY